MDKSANLIIAETKQGIIDILNKSGLPIAVNFLIISNLSEELNKQAQAVIVNESEQYSKEHK